MKITSNIKAVKNDILTLLKRLEADKLSRIVAFTARALILNRVQQRGLDSNEVPFKPYSKRPFAIPYATFINDNKFAFNQTALARVKRLLAKRRAIPYSLSDDEVELFTARGGTLYIVFGGGYEQFRRLAGRQTKKVDMTFTSQMLNDFNLVPLGQNWGLGFSNVFNARKYASNVRRRGQFLILSSNEIVKIQKTIRDEVARLLK